MKLIKIKFNVVNQEAIKKDREYKNKHNSPSGYYIGGYGKDFTGHIAVVEYTLRNEIKQQWEKNLMKNSKGYYVTYNSKRNFFTKEELILVGLQE